MLKSNGLRRQKIRLKKFSFSPKLFTQISPKSCRHNVVPNRFSSRFSTSRTNGPRLLSRAKVGTHTRLRQQDRTQRLTCRSRGLPSLGHSAVLCCLRNPFYSTMLLYTYISRFFVNPQHQQMRKIWQSCCHKFYPQTAFHRVFQLLAQTAHVRFHERKGVHTRLSEKNRTQRHTRRNTGVSNGGWYLSTLGAFHTFRKPCVARYQNGKLCRF